MFFERPQEAFANLVRWLAPDGRFAVAVWGPQSEKPYPWSVYTQYVATPGGGTQIGESARQTAQSPT